MKRRATVKLRMALRELDESRQIVMARSGGRCERCGDRATQCHHRRPRMAGGSTAIGMNAPSNLCALCSDCHMTVESHRAAAIEAGWLLSSLAHAERVAIRLHTGRWVRLLTDGTYEDVTEGGAA